MKLPRRLAIAIALLSLTAAAAEEIAIREDESVFAVVTHKGGFAASQAHNHLIAATGYEATLVFDPAEPLAHCAAVIQVDEDLQPPANNLATLAIVDVRNEADAARIVFAPWIVQTLLCGGVACCHYRLATSNTGPRVYDAALKK